MKVQDCADVCSNCAASTCYIDGFQVTAFWPHNEPLNDSCERCGKGPAYVTLYYNERDMSL